MPRTRTRRRVKKAMIKRMPRVCNIHSFVRYATTPGSLLALAGSPLAGALTFSLAETAEFTDLTALYDSYRITGVKVSIFYRGTNLSVFESANNADTGLPILYTAIDLDDATTPSLTHIRATKGCKVTYIGHKGVRGKSVFLRPRFLNNIWRTGASTDGYTIGNRKSWLDMAYNNVQHFGLKYLIDPPATGTPGTRFTFDLNIKYYIQCKDPR